MFVSLFVLLRVHITAYTYAAPLDKTNSTCVGLRLDASLQPEALLCCGLKDLLDSQFSGGLPRDCQKYFVVGVGTRICLHIGGVLVRPDGGLSGLWRRCVGVPLQYPRGLLRWGVKTKVVWVE